MENRFNLIDEPWIPITDQGRVSLRQVFSQPEFRTCVKTVRTAAVRCNRLDNARAELCLRRRYRADKPCGKGKTALRKSD